MHCLNGKSMKLFYKVVAIIFHTYDDRGAHSPYFDAVLTVVIILFLHAVHIGLLLTFHRNTSCLGAQRRVDQCNGSMGHYIL